MRSKMSISVVFCKIRLTLSEKLQVSEKNHPKNTPIDPHGKFWKKNFDDFFSTEKLPLGFRLRLIVKFSDYQMFVINIFVVNNAFFREMPVNALTF